MKSKKDDSISSSYYETTDFSEIMKNSKKKKIFTGAKKRITINISEAAYIDANELDHFMNMGYQNVLKTAMALGLRDLHNAIYERKDVTTIIAESKVTYK